MSSSALQTCPNCHLPIAPVGVPFGYAGPLCRCGHYFGQPMQPSEETIRRIVREELARAARGET